MEDITILFVDDEKHILQSLERYLINEPYKKLFAQSADQALEILAQKTVHVVVTDMKMPGKDGLTLLRQIKAEYPDTVRMVLSGFIDVAQIIPSINTGEIFRYITKPLEPSEFKDTLNDAIEHYLLRRDKEELIKSLTYLVEDMNETGKELEKANRDYAEANKELKEFAYIVSHDLKAPLRAISQLTHWISQDYSHVFDDDGKLQMDLVIKRVKRMDGLIDGILRYSQVGRIREKEEPLDLNLLTNEVIDNLAAPDHVKIIIEDKLPVVMRNSIRMEQVLQNLIGNAIKFMDKEEGIIKVRCSDEGSSWKFSVSDNGPGIDKRYHDKIFQIFQTLTARDEHESTGIGLTLVKKIIRLYGGSVWVESQTDQGTTFFFTLPKKGKKCF